MPYTKALIPARMMKAILFDVHGTLADNITVLYTVYEDFLRYFVCQGSRDEFNFLAGASLREIVNYLKNRHQIEGDSEVLYQQYHDRLHKEYSQKAPLFPGAKEFIKKMHKQGMRLAVVSGALRSLLESFLDAHELGPYFELIVAGDDVAKSKPDPMIYTLALKQLALPAKEAIVIEDSLNGVRASTGAGIQTILLTHSHSDNWEAIRSWNTGLVVPATDWKEVGQLVRKDHLLIGQ